MDMKNIGQHLMADAIHGASNLSQLRNESRRMSRRGSMNRRGSMRKIMLGRTTGNENAGSSGSAPDSNDAPKKAMRNLLGLNTGNSNAGTGSASDTNDAARKAMELLMKKQKKDEVDLAKSMVEKWQKKAEEKQQKRKVENRVFRPLDDFIQHWNMANMIVMMYILIDIPIRMVFEIDTYVLDPNLGIRFWAFVSLLVDLFFLTDMAITFNTAYVDTLKQDLVTDRRLIAVHYLKSWFLLDLSTSIPIDPILSLFDVGGSYLALPKLIRILKAIRILKIFRVMKLMKVMGDWEKKDGLSITVSRLVKFGVLVFMIAHISGCAWMGTTVINRDRAQNVYESSWLVRYEFEDTPRDELYLVCLYWAFTTLSTVGYGDLAPGCRVEYLLAVFVMILGSSLFGYIIGNIASLVTHEDDTAILIRDKIRSVSAYMRYRNLPEQMQNKIRHHYEYSWKQTQVYDEEQILSELPPTIRTEVALCIHKDTINQVSFLSELGHDVVPLVVTKLRPVLAPPAETVVREGFVGREMYLCMAGLLEGYLGGSGLSGDGGGALTQQELTVKKIRPGHEFAEYTLIMTVVKHPLSVRSLTFCDLFVLQKADFDEIGALFPHVIKTVRELGMKRFKRQLSDLRAMQNKKQDDSNNKEEEDVLPEGLGAHRLGQSLAMKMKRGSVARATKELSSAKGAAPRSPYGFQKLGSVVLNQSRRSVRRTFSTFSTAGGGGGPGGGGGGNETKDEAWDVDDDDEEEEGGGGGGKARGCGARSKENSFWSRGPRSTRAASSSRRGGGTRRYREGSAKPTTEAQQAEAQAEREKKLTKLFASAFQKKKRWESTEDFTPAMRNKISVWKSRAQMALAIQELEHQMQDQSPKPNRVMAKSPYGHPRVPWRGLSMGGGPRPTPAPSSNHSEVAPSPANAVLSISGTARNSFSFDGEPPGGKTKLLGENETINDQFAYDIILQLHTLEHRMAKMETHQSDHFGKIEALLHSIANGEGGTREGGGDSAPLRQAKAPRRRSSIKFGAPFLRRAQTQGTPDSSSMVAQIMENTPSQQKTDGELLRRDSAGTLLLDEDQRGSLHSLEEIPLHSNRAKNHQKKKGAWGVLSSGHHQQVVPGLGVAATKAGRDPPPDSGRVSVESSERGSASSKEPLLLHQSATSRHAVLLQGATSTAAAAVGAGGQEKKDPGEGGSRPLTRRPLDAFLKPGGGMAEEGEFSPRTGGTF